MLPTPPQPSHLLTSAESSVAREKLQADSWHSALAYIATKARCTPDRALKTLADVADLDEATTRRIRDSAQWPSMAIRFQTPLWQSWLVLSVLIIAAVAGAYTLTATHYYNTMIPLLATSLVARWTWLTRGGSEHARVVLGGVLLVVLSGLVAAALLDGEHGTLPPGALPMILWCLISLGGGLAFSVWGAIAPMGANTAATVRSARIGWRLALVNLATTILFSALVMYWIGLRDGDAGEAALNALLRFCVFMIIYAAFSAYLLAPLARNGTQAALALALPVAVGLFKWTLGVEGALFGYLLLLSAIQISAVGLTAFGLLIIALWNRPKEKQDGLLTPALLAAGVAAIGWSILQFMLHHAYNTGSLEPGFTTWLWVGIPALITAVSATVAAYGLSSTQQHDQETSYTTTQS